MKKTPTIRTIYADTLVVSKKAGRVALENGREFGANLMIAGREMLAKGEKTGRETSKKMGDEIAKINGVTKKTGHEVTMEGMKVKKAGRDIIKKVDREATKIGRTVKKTGRKIVTKAKIAEKKVKKAYSKARSGK